MVQAVSRFFTFRPQTIAKLSFPHTSKTSAIFKNLRVEVGRSKFAGLPYFVAGRRRLPFRYSYPKIFGASYNVILKPPFCLSTGLVRFSGT